MTVQALAERLNAIPFHAEDPELEITGGYCGDLLSWVMGRAPAGCAWLTIMSNVNVAAVAALSDVGCVVLTEGVQPDPPLLQKAQVQGINLYGTSMSTYESAAILAAALAEQKQDQ